MEVEAKTKPLPNRLPLFRSLYGRFAGLFFFSVSAVALFQLYVSGLGFLQFSDEFEQQIRWGVAAELANALQPLVSERIEPELIEERVFQLTIGSPELSVYLLDELGNIVWSLTRVLGSTAQKQISLEPIRQALTFNAPTLPIYGDDPMESRSVQRTFSVAPIRLAGKNGYLYVPFNSGVPTALREHTAGFFYGRTVATGFLLTLCVSLLLGYWLLRYLTRRFGDLSTIVSEFERGDFKRRIATQRLDEVGLLGNSINSMADAIVSSQAALEQRDRLRRELVAAVSHDLRTPLTAIKGNLEIVLTRMTDEISDGVKEVLKVISRNTSLQHALLNDLFELAKLDAREISVNLDDVHLCEVIQQSVSSFAPLAKTKSIEIGWRSEPEHLPEVSADPKLLARALGNLLDNALRYTPEGGRVLICASLEETGRRVRVEVSDTGPGISAEHRDKIFEKFYQVNPGEQGAGLGLAIVKRIAELHDSELELSRGPEGGSHFALFLAVGSSCSR